MIPVEEWWDILANYNQFIMPFQFIWAAVGIILTIWFLIKPSKYNNLALKIFFIVSFMFIAIVFFSIKGQDLPAFVAQTICFGSLALLLFVDIWFKKFEFKIPENNLNKIIMYISLAIVFLYPVVGLLAGHSYPRMIIFGTFPCPTVALALVFATASLPEIKLDWKCMILFSIWTLLLIWAIPFPIAIQIPIFGAYEDIIMLTIGIFGLIRLIWILVKKGISFKKNKDDVQTLETLPQV